MAAITLVDVAHSSAQSPRSTQFSLLSLPDPSNDNTSPIRDYMLLSSSCHRSFARANDPLFQQQQQQQPHDIYEIQTVLPHSGKYASYFVGSRIISNPALHITTRVDPLFFALAHFQRARSEYSRTGHIEKWQPWDQVLGDMPSPILRALKLDTKLNISGVNKVGQLGHLLDVSDMCGDDLILCKFSEERTLKWLVAKFERSVVGLRRRLHEKKRKAAERRKELDSMQGGSGAFTSTFAVADEETTTPPSGTDEKKSLSVEEGVADSSFSKEEEQSLQVGALQLICDYLPIEWKSKLTLEVGLTDADWMGKKKSKSNANGEGTTITGEKRSRASWEGMVGQEEADALMQYSIGGSAGSNGASIITPGGKKDVINAKSVGLKKLAKVNTKGMKSLASFFGASKKKKKKIL